MQLSFYDASIMCYEQILRSTANVLNAGREHAEASDMPLSDIVDYRLHETMNPFSFQVISVWHHSYGAVQGMRAGEFNPPPSKPGIDYAGLCDLIDEGLAELQKETPDSMSALSGKNMYFRFGEMEIPFTTDNFWRPSRNPICTFMPPRPIPCCASWARHWASSISWAT